MQFSFIGKMVNMNRKLPSSRIVVWPNCFRIFSTGTDWFGFWVFKSVIMETSTLQRLDRWCVWEREKNNKQFFKKKKIEPFLIACQLKMYNIDNENIKHCYPVDIANAMFIFLFFNGNERKRTRYENSLNMCTHFLHHRI